MTPGRARIVVLALQLVAIVGGLAPAAPSFAEPTAEERSIAATLFADGRRLMQEERFAEACPRFEESQRLDPSGGTLLNLAMCLRLVGRTASAQARFAEALAAARRDGRADRIDACKAALQELDAEVATLVLEVDAGPCAAQTLMLNDVEVPRLAWGSALPVDPGDAVIRASAAGCLTWTGNVRVEPRARLAQRVPRLAPAPPPVPNRPAPDVPGPADERASPLGGVARIDVDGKLRGATAAVGLALEATPSFELAAMALLGGTLGIEADARVAPFGTRARLRPVAFAGGAIFFDERAYPGARLGAGLEWDVHRAVALGFTSGAAIFPEVPAGYDHVVFVPAVDLFVRP